MSYLQFHLLFIVPPLLLLHWRAPAMSARLRMAYLLLPLIALLYTTPWDNYLVAQGVWSYGSDRVLGTIGWVPVEEYLFFVLQPLLVLGWIRRTGLLEREPVSAGAPLALAARITGTAVWLAAAWTGAALLDTPSARYAALILAWAAPVLALQWAFTGDATVLRARAYLRALVPPTLWLWLADAVAIGQGIWDIAPAQSSGIKLFVLPVEEMLFFLVTNLLVVHGALLLCEPARLRAPQPAAA